MGNSKTPHKFSLFIQHERCGKLKFLSNFFQKHSFTLKLEIKLLNAQELEMMIAITLLPLTS